MSTTRPATKAKLLGALLLCAASAWGASRDRVPYAGYVYPAGGRQNSTFRVTIGGQNLLGVSKVYVSGGGVQVSIIEHVKPLTNKQRGEIGQHLRVLLRQRWAEALRPAGASRRPEQATEDTELPPLPDHPWVRGLENKSLEELQALQAMLYDPKRQLNPQIAEWVIADITIDAAAQPGTRELRVETPQGLSNPIRFEVGSLAEVIEQEPNSTLTQAKTPTALPEILNGQIMPGDVDCFRLKARRGQKLVAVAQARALIPYLADAVPGWFQATLALYDDQGKELAYVDDYRFDPDPVLFYEVPQDGEYVLRICDAIYRGREDFVYRITVGELPFITQMFPLGGREGLPTTVAVTGWNLPWKQVQLDTSPGGDWLRQATWRANGVLSNQLPYAVDTLPELAEKEPNNTAAEAMPVSLPLVVNGRIAHAGDTDMFRFTGRAGEEIVAEVYAHRLGSPLDSLLRLTDASGHVLAWNDDHPDKEAGLLPHQADSYLTARIPSAGAYTLQLTDAQSHGGEEYGYRLRIGAPRPDFALRLTPASMTVPAGRVTEFSILALRKDGFSGPIELALKNAPPGFALSGARIPAGRDRVRLTLTAPRERPTQPLIMQMEGRALVDGKTLIRPAIPADEMMQAFAYQHLVPAQDLLVSVTGARFFAPSLTFSSDAPLRIPAGGVAVAQVKVTARQEALAGIRLQLSDPPKGVTLQDVAVKDGGLALTLKAEPGLGGYADNLIVEAFTEVDAARLGAKAGTGTRRVPLGMLPALAFEVVKP